MHTQVRRFIKTAIGFLAIGLMIGGSVIAARCTGLTAAAKVDLAPHFTFQ